MSTRDQSGRWLFGPAPDLLLGCGLGYVLLFAVFLLAGTERASISALGVVPLISILTGTPHYGATLLRVYERREERRAYAFFAVWVTAAVWGLFYLGLYSALLGSLLVTLYLTWSPWHYTGQNYGIAVMFLRRRGVALDAGAKRLLYLSFLLSYALTVLALHGADTEGTYSAFTPYQGGAFRLIRLGIPSPVWEAAFVGIGIAYLGVLAVTARVLLQRASARDLAPTATLALTQMLWFSLPTAARFGGLLGPDGPLSLDATAYAFFWVATGHSVQYLWITTFYAAGSRSAGPRTFFLIKTLVAGSFIWSVPGLVYGLTVLGTRFGGVAQGADTFVLLAAVVNLHHFILDGAIWKLRDGRVAKVLIRRAPETPAMPEAVGAPRFRWGALVVYGLGTIFTLQVLTSWTEHRLFFEPAIARGDLRAAQRSLDRLVQIRSDAAHDYLRLGHLAADEGVHKVALRAYQDSLEKRPTAAAHLALGRMAQRRGESQAAVESFEKAVEVNPDHAEALNLLGLAWLRMDEPARAEEALERAVALVPGNETLQASLARARSRRAALAERTP
ncbi:MAG: tetratricopeptide repeat protein [Myxococcota bacterium]|nr:tetratricopeptide repeat protein [Myxococcota bacterium]